MDVDQRLIEGHTMTAIALAEPSLAALKKTLRKDLPDIRSSHLTEAMAAALDFRTHASLIATLPGQASDPSILLLDNERFQARLGEFGYQLASDEFRFEWLDDCPDVISTMPDSGYDIEYRSQRDKAWRNLMVLTVNEGIRQKLFSLRVDDNRWPGAEPGSQGHRGTGYVFEFKLPDGKPAKGYVSDAGFGELNVHAAVFPKEDWVRAMNSGFHAGDAFARGWLERERGAWLQSSQEFFNCRKWLIEDLANMEAKPIGFGDRGRVIV